MPRGNDVIIMKIWCVRIFQIAEADRQIIAPQVLIMHAAS